MRKKALFYALIASGLFVGCLASCNDKSTANTSSSVAETSSSTSTSVPQVEASSTSTSNSQTEASSTSTSNSQTQSYNLVDDEKSQKAYSELLKSFPNITYDDFLMNGTDSFGENEKTFRYMSSSVTISSNNTFVDKTITIKDSNGNDLTSTYSKYINNEWVKITDSKFYNNERKTIYNINLETDSYVSLEEYTYDEDGNFLTEKYSLYINDEWVKSREYIYINHERKNIYSMSLKTDGTFDSKWEGTYDDEGNQLTAKTSRYINNDWVRTAEYKYINGETKAIFILYISDEGTFIFKDEYTYDDDGNLLSEIDSKYVNNEWLKVYESRRINNVVKTIYQLKYANDEGTYDCKEEYTYDDNGNELTHTVFYFDSSNWDSNLKFEYTYDNNGNKLTEKRSEYISNEWVKTEEYKYINSEKKTTYYTFFSNGSMDSLDEFTYDDNGNKITEVESRYIENEWVKIKEYKYFNDHQVTLYDITFKADGTFDYKYESTYDENKNKLAEKRSKYLDGVWVKVEECKYFNNRGATLYYISFNGDGTFKSKYESTYNDNGIQLTSTTFIYRNNNWVKKEVSKYFNNGLTGEYTYYLNDTFDALYEDEYDDNGVLLSSRTSRYYNNNWHVSREREYTYDDNGYKIEIEIEYINDEYHYKYEKTYDANDNLLISITNARENNAWVKNSKFVCEYDASNNRIREISSIYRNNAWHYYSKDEYTYDDQGKRATKIESTFVGNDWVKIEEYIYISNVEKATCEITLNYDGTYKNKYEYTYDAQGNKTSTSYYLYQNGQWVLQN